MSKGKEMEFHIDHQQVKRTIEGDFKILGRGEDLLLLARAITEAVDENPGFYGWIEVRRPLPSTINTAPIGWRE